jgi:transposase
MFGMFDFLTMAPYEQRKVANFTQGELTVDTCAVSDSRQPYETAVCHPKYNDGRWVIVEMYDTKEQAQKGHERWVKTMTAPELPAMLKDVSTAGIAEFCDDLGGDDWRDKPVLV